MLLLPTTLVAMHSVRSLYVQMITFERNYLWLRYWHWFTLILSRSSLVVKVISQSLAAHGRNTNRRKTFLDVHLCMHVMR